MFAGAAPGTQDVASVPQLLLQFANLYPDSIVVAMAAMALPMRHSATASAPRQAALHTPASPCAAAHAASPSSIAPPSKPTCIPSLAGRLPSRPTAGLRRTQRHQVCPGREAGWQQPTRDRGGGRWRRAVSSARNYVSPCRWRPHRPHPPTPSHCAAGCTGRFVQWRLVLVGASTAAARWCVRWLHPSVNPRETGLL